MPSLIKPSPPNLVLSIPYPGTPSDLTLTTLSCGTVVADTTTLTEFIFRTLQLSRYSARDSHLRASGILTKRPWGLNYIRYVERW
jgi:hypothetical protein